MSLEGDMAAVKSRQETEITERRRMVDIQESIERRLEVIEINIAVLKGQTSEGGLVTAIIAGAFVTAVLLYDPELGWSILAKLGWTP